MNRALLVGINNYPSAPLNGCLNDISDMAKFLTTKCEFSPDEVRLLADSRATKSNILERLAWLLTGLHEGDRIFFHFSGHGVQLPARNSQGEVHGLDEAICPFDFDWTDEHSIRDKEFNNIFASIPRGVDFVWVSDSCHSGDLESGIPNMNQPGDSERGIPIVNKPGDPERGIPIVNQPGTGRGIPIVNQPAFHDRGIPIVNKGSRTILPPVDINWRMQTAKYKKISPIGFNTTARDLNLALISGCKSDQTSAEAEFNSKYNGALTYFLLKHLNESNALSAPLTQIVQDVNLSLKNNGYSQEPQLEGDDNIKNLPFLK